MGGCTWKLFQSLAEIIHKKYMQLADIVLVRKVYIKNNLLGYSKQRHIALLLILFPVVMLKQDRIYIKRTLALPWCLYQIN